MKNGFRWLYIGVIILGTGALTVFILGTTALFQRYFDLIHTVLLVLYGIPCLGGVLVFSGLLFKKWQPSNKHGYGLVITGISIVIIFSVLLVRNTPVSGWLVENVNSDTLKKTADQQYEYRLDLVNLFQKNSEARLYTRNIKTGEEQLIDLAIDTDSLTGLFNIESDIEKDWVIMHPNEDGYYYLITTEELAIPEEKFKVDMENGESSKI